MRKIIIQLLLCLVALQCPAFVTRHSLNGTWNLYYWKQPGRAAITSPDKMSQVDRKMIKATVPGNVELDLQREGLIKDPMIDLSSG